MTTPSQEISDQIQDMRTYGLQEDSPGQVAGEMESHPQSTPSQHLLVATLLVLVGVHPVTKTIVVAMTARLLQLPHQHLEIQQVVISLL